MEGFESNVIWRTRELIRSGLVKNILHESNYIEATKATLEKIISLFEELVETGYKIHAIINSGGSITSRFNTGVGPGNLRLRNGTFAGSVLHRMLANRHTNIWWKRLEEDGPSTPEASVDPWRELEVNHTT